MEAKDTVMDDKQTEKAFEEEWRVDFREPLPSCAARRAVAQAQAEISFKLGHQQGVEDFTECAKYIEKGRREVVEWLKEQSQFERCDPDTMAYFCDFRWVDEADWQSKLKEWGL